MAINGKIEWKGDYTKNMGPYNYEFSWERTAYSIENNTSTIHWKLNARNGYVREYVFQEKISVTIDSQTLSFNVDVSLPSVYFNKYVTFAEGTTVISHNNDGTKNFSFSVYYDESEKSFSSSAELDAVPRPPKVNSVTTPFTDESVPTLMYTPYAKGVPVEACISFTGETDDIPYRVIDNATYVGAPVSYRFNFTDEEKATLWTKLKDGTSTTVRFKVRSYIEGAWYEDYRVSTLNFVNYAPTLTPVVVATNDDRTRSLTGDSSGNTLIRYYSDVDFRSGAAARKGAYVDNQYVKCGGQIIAGNMPEGTLEDVWSGDFEFSVTDTNGYITRQTLNKNIVPYIKLTCSIESAQLDTNGKLTFTIVGKYFDGSFGAVNNSLELSYDLKENGNDMFERDQPLGVVKPTVDEEGNYRYTHTLTGLNHTNQYRLIVYAFDEITPAGLSAMKVLGNVPIFDWGKDDFNFNVPVEICNRFKVTGEGQIHGRKTDGSFVQVIDPCNNNNNLVIGYGNYAEELETPTGDLAGTNLYGNTINLIHKNGITINWSPLADFVVEQASNGVWHYRKWSSGRVELSGYRNISSVACNTALGSMYQTAVLSSPNFPITVNNPKVTANYEGSGNGAFVYFTQLATSSKPADFYLVRPTTSSALNGNVNYYVTGTWK